MSGKWVWRADGTLQCGMGREELLGEARRQLAAILGEDAILSAEKRTLPGVIITPCGAPTGRVNAFELTEEGFWLLFHGFAGPIGFRPWVEPPIRAASSKAAGSSTLDAAGFQGVSIVGSRGGAVPCQIAELYGRMCQVYDVGVPLNTNFFADRFNVGLERGRIRELWFG